MTLMNQLKSATEQPHMALEQQLDLMDRAWSLAEYTGLLERMLGLYAPLEARLQSSAVAPLLALTPRLKTPLLAADLADLQVSPEAQAALPRCVDLPEVHTLPEALGVLYVLEGATLGGQLISRQLQATLGISTERAGHFYASYGANVGPMWREFKLLVNAQQFSDAERATLIDTASATFNAFAAWLPQGAAA